MVALHAGSDFFFKCPMSFLTYPQRDQCPLPGSNWDILFISQVNHITIEPPVEPRKIQHLKKKYLNYFQNI